MGLKRYHDAVAFFGASARQCGAHHVTTYNVGICYWYMDDFAQAHTAFRQSVELRPDYAEAAAWLQRCDAKLAGERFLRQQAEAAAAAAGATGTAGRAMAATHTDSK